MTGRSFFKTRCGIISPPLTRPCLFPFLFPIYFFSVSAGNAAWNEMGSAVDSHTAAASKRSCRHDNRSVHVWNFV